MRFLLRALLSCFPFFLASCFTRAVVTRYDGSGNVAMVSKVFSSSDMGVVVTGESDENKAGLGGALTGDVGGSGGSTSAEAQNPGSIVAGDISMGGVITNSTAMREWGDNINRFSRNIVAGKTAGRLFGVLEGRNRISGRTDIAKINSETRQLKIKSGVEKAKIFAPRPGD